MSEHGKELRCFLQLDAFGKDTVDADDFPSGLFAGMSVDPQNSPTIVRIRIDPDADRSEVLRQLHALVDWFERVDLVKQFQEDKLRIHLGDEEPF